MSDTSYRFFIYYGFEKTVIEAQVLTPVRLLEESGLHFKLVFMENFKTWLSYLLGGEEGKRFGRLKEFEFAVLPRIPKNFLWLNSLLVLFVLRGDLRRKKRVVIQARGFQATQIALGLKKIFRKIRVICDVRGVESAEYDYSARLKSKELNFFQKWWLRKLTFYESRSLKEANKNFCVSSSLIGHLKTFIPRSEQDWLHVPCAVKIPNLTSESMLKARESKRDSLGLKDKLVVVYSGAIGPWHLPEKIAEIFAEILKIEPASYFLGITPSIKELASVFGEHQIPPDKFKILEVPFPEISSTLIAGDIGLLLREDNPLNNFSCPTKFGEYLAAGLHIISTQAIFDVREIIEKEKVGTIIGDLNNPAEVGDRLKNAVASTKDWPARAAKSVSAAEKYFSWDHFLLKMKNVYLELSK